LTFANISTLIAARRLYIAEIQFKKRRATQRRTAAPRAKKHAFSCGTVERGGGQATNLH